MKTKLLNRNFIKIIALVTMLIDHVGYVLYGIVPYWLYFVLRCIGRISFPLFAYFVAEGFYYTKNKIKYFITILIFALISQLPYSLLFNGSTTMLNVLFTFLLSVVLMFTFDKLWRETFLELKIAFVVIVFAMFTFVSILLPLLFDITFDYGFYGIMLTFAFYVFKFSKTEQIVSFVILLIIYTLVNVIGTNITFFSFISIFSIFAIPFIILFNGEKGKLNLKYIFYWFYPIHIAILYIINILIK